MSIVNSTISGNTGSAGGGIFSLASSSHLSVANSTITGNTGGSGGGIYSSVYASSSTSISVVNSTISGNTSPNNGGGIYSVNSSVNLKGSIVWSDSVASIFNGSSSITTSNGYNIFSDAPTGSVATDQLNIDSVSLNLQPLANNGGPTQTMLPGVGSVAINMGDPSDLTDAQNGPIIGVRDVGAAERSVSTPVSDSCSGLFISEYIEGSSFNKALEIYNASSLSIDLSQYEIKKYTNGSSTGTAISLSGILAPYDVYVVAHTSANASILGISDMQTGSLSFTGNDAVSLERNDTLIDLIGVIGEDPSGGQWGNGTKDHTLVRKTTIVGGITTNPSTFDPLVEWNILGIDNISSLGTHVSACSNTTNLIEIETQDFYSLSES